MSSVQPGEPANLDPDQIATRAFERSRRGFDEDEVRAFLQSLAPSCGSPSNGRPMRSVVWPRSTDAAPTSVSSTSHS